MMTIFKVIIKLIAFIVLMGLYAIASLGILCLNFFSIQKSRELMQHLVRLVGKGAIKILNIKVNVIGEIPSLNDHYFIASNHLGYLDIFTISKYFPAIFITSVEMRETKFLGDVCYMAGCHFVERRSLKKLAKEIREISETIRENINIVLFPEAKSTNGEKVIDFKPSLFEAAMRERSTILPLCLNYKSIDGVEVDINNRDQLFWYGDMSFFPHFINLLHKKKIEIDINILEILDAKDFSDRNELADKTYELISKQYKKIN